MKKISLLLGTLTLSLTLTNAWYPQYTVMASDFVLGQYFMAPISFHSMGLYALGEEFQYLSSASLDRLSINPAAGLGGTYNMLQLEFGGQELFKDGFDLSNGTIAVPDYVYSPYLPESQYRQTEEQEDYEPTFRLIYLGQPLKNAKHTRLGVAFDWIYGISEFYQPYDQWGIYDRNAVGTAYDSEVVDPYQDYRLREAGDDQNVNQGYHLSLFLAQAVTANTALGIRISRVNESVNGDLNDYTFNDHSDYAADYFSLYDSRKERKQSYTNTDIMLGLNSHLSNGTEVGLSGGVLSGNLDRLFNESDSSSYYSFYGDRYPDLTLDDSTFYSSGSQRSSERNWEYAGRTIYLGLQYQTPAKAGRQYRFVLYGENRRSDLTESEALDQRSTHASQYFSLDDTSLTNYHSNSFALVARTGTGDLRQQVLRASGGVDWELSPNFRFLGGCYLQYTDRAFTSAEPFSGEKYATTDRTGDHYPNYSIIQHQIDDQEFAWQRSEQSSTVGIPVGLQISWSPFFQFQTGLTKIFRQSTITEGYDVVVQRHYNSTERDGSITASDENNYVDGYAFPDNKTFDNGFNFNAGLVFRQQDRFSVSVVFSNAFSTGYAIKLGGQLNW